MQAVLDWARVVVATLARAVVVLALGLAFWAVAPAALGWHPTTTMSGSMEPGIAVGDVVVSRPVAPTELRVGQVLLTDDPDHDGRLRFHRYAEVREGGGIVTKGDANPDADSSPVAAEQVHGVGVLRVPFVGLPVTWVREGRTVPLALLGLAAVLLLALTTVDRSLRHLDEAGRGDEGAGPRASGHRAPASRRALLDHRRRTRRRHRAGALAIVVGATSIGALLPAQAVAAPFHATTGTTGTWAAATLLPPTGVRCTNTAGGVVISYTGQGAVLDPPVGGHRLVVGGVPEGPVAPVTPGTAAGSISWSPTPALAVGAPMEVGVQATSGTAWTSATSPTVRVSVTSVLGLVKIVQCG